MSHRPPNRSSKDSQFIKSILREVFAVTGVKPPLPYVGSHVLRHSLATKLVRSSASLEEIGDLLRHRSRATTMIYAKLDTDESRSLPSPGRSRRLLVHAVESRRSKISTPIPTS
ncbi:tyrosine-type recombinase/integrase [Sinorhizobium meliloti]|uniref:tyrosine-type recombinase/integrase n=1 Tax=Rhizobium meliloti TaxID=382 RepID=UPI002380BECE|nr:tyrosine-type recombinase/integrase [Sinorhizobium meliloti]